MFYHIQMFLFFMKSNCLLFSFVTNGFGIISKNPWPNPHLWRFTPIFSCKNFMVLALIHKLLINLELIFVHNMVQLHSFAGWYPVVHKPFVEEAVLSPFNYLGILVINQLVIDVWVSFRTLTSIPLFYMSFFMLVTCCFD